MLAGHTGGEAVQLPVYVISGADTGIVALVGTGINVLVVVVAVNRPEGLASVMKLVVGDTGDRGVDSDVPVVRVVDTERVALPVIGIDTERDAVELDTGADADELDGNTEGPTIEVLVEIVPDEEEPIVLREEAGDRVGGVAGVVGDVGIVGVIIGGGVAGVVVTGGGVVAGGGVAGVVVAVGVVAGGGPPVEVPWRAASCIITGASHVGTP